MNYSAKITVRQNLPKALTLNMQEDQKLNSGESDDIDADQDYAPSGGCFLAF